MIYFPVYSKQGETGDSFLSKNKHIRLDSIPLLFHFIFHVVRLNSCVIMAVYIELCTGQDLRNADDV